MNLNSASTRLLEGSDAAIQRNASDRCKNRIHFLGCVMRAAAAGEDIPKIRTIRTFEIQGRSR